MKILKKAVLFALILCCMPLCVNAEFGLQKEKLEPMTFYQVEYTGQQWGKKVPGTRWLPDIYPGEKKIFINRGMDLEIPTQVYLYTDKSNYVYWVVKNYHLKDIKFLYGMPMDNWLIKVFPNGGEKGYVEMTAYTHDDKAVKIRSGEEGKTILFYTETEEGENVFKTLTVDSFQADEIYLTDMEDGKSYKFTKYTR